MSSTAAYFGSSGAYWPHRQFSTTEKFYGATRSAQAAATVLTRVLEARHRKSALVRGIPGAPALTPAELLKLKALLNSL